MEKWKRRVRGKFIRGVGEDKSREAFVFTYNLHQFRMDSFQH